MDPGTCCFSEATTDPGQAFFNIIVWCGVKVSAELMTNATAAIVADKWSRGLAMALHISLENGQASGHLLIVLWAVVAMAIRTTMMRGIFFDLASEGQGLVDGGSGDPPNSLY